MTAGTGADRSVHCFAVDTIAEAGPLLDVPAVEARDLVVIAPAGQFVLAGEPHEMLDAAAVFGDAIAVAACATPDAGGSVTRVEPHPLAWCGPAKAVRGLIAACGESGEDDDRERLAAAVGTGKHDVVLDSGVQFFAVLDGTGTDVVVAAGRLYAGGERPVIALSADGGVLDRLRRALADRTAADLVRLLRYEARATDPAEHPGCAAEAAPEILVLPFWTPEFCAPVIRAAEAAGIWAADPDDPVPGSEVSLFSISPRLVALLEEDFRARLWPELRAHWPEVAVTSVADAFVIHYEAGSVLDALPLHHDVAQVSASIRLNAGYDGGALEFPRQQWDTGAVGVGHLVVWPSLVTHPHRAAPVRRGVKYGLTVWFDLPER